MELTKDMTNPFSPQDFLKPIQPARDCTCLCRDGGPCGHDFREDVVFSENPGSAICTYCGMTSVAHDMKLLNR